LRRAGAHEQATLRVSHHDEDRMAAEVDDLIDEASEPVERGREPARD
jgi:hypothetical protein